MQRLLFSTCRWNDESLTTIHDTADFFFLNRNITVSQGLIQYCGAARLNMDADSGAINVWNGSLNHRPGHFNAAELICGFIWAFTTLTNQPAGDLKKSLRKYKHLVKSSF